MLLLLLLLHHTENMSLSNQFAYAKINYYFFVVVYQPRILRDFFPELSHFSRCFSRILQALATNTCFLELLVTSGYFWPECKFPSWPQSTIGSSASTQTGSSWLLLGQFYSNWINPHRVNWTLVKIFFLNKNLFKLQKPHFHLSRKSSYCRRSKQAKKSSKEVLVNVLRHITSL